MNLPSIQDAVTLHEKATWLFSRLTPELDLYTVCKLAKRDLADNNLRSAVARLLVDSDKILMHDRELYDAIQFLSKEIL